MTAREPGGSLIRRFLKETGGAVAAEYVLMAGLISIAILVGVLAYTGQLGAVFNDLPTHF